MKKRALWILTFVLILSVALIAGGCGQEQPVQNTETPAPQVEIDEDAIVYERIISYFDGLKQNNNMIAPSVVYEALQSDPGAYFILDIRAADDYAKGHIEAASILNIAWAEVGSNMHLLPRDRTIVVTCYSGQSAGQTVAALRLAGYDAISLQGGMNNGWLKAELPIVD